MKQFKKCLPFLGIIFSIALGYSQEDTASVKKDSVNIALLENYNKRLSEIEKQRVEDSINKSNLEAQINALKTTDNLKKEELQAQLTALTLKEKTRIANKKAKIDSLKNTTQGFPVIGFFNDTLFVLYSKLGSFSPKERADIISERIKKLVNNYDFKANSLKVEDAETVKDIVWDSNIIMSISETDALWNDTSKTELAEVYREKITAAVLEYRDQTSFATLAKQIGLALLVLLVIILLIYYISKAFNWTAHKIQLQENQKIQGIKIKNYVLFDAKRQVNALLLANKLIKWFVILIAVYIALPILFGLFPWTEHFADTLFGYILNPLKNILMSFWNYLPNLITILVIIIVFRYALKGISFLKDEIAKGNLTINGFYADWAAPTYQIIRILVIAFMFIVIFPYLPGSESPIFKGVSVFLGFLFTFGSAGSLSNIIAGLVLTYMRLFTIGDRVKIGEVTGDVIEKSSLVTRVRTAKNEIISIPNSTVMNSHTINYSSDAPAKGLIIHTTVTIGYDVPWKDMYEVLIEAALRTDLVLKEPKPFVLQTSLEDFYVAYQINAYVREANKQATIYSDLHQNIQDVCNERGIEILSPHYRAARDGNATTIPSDYLPKDYVAPSFNVKTKTEDKQT
ncbi:MULTISPECIES: mechanosensitive ion channel family protein [Aequorivita]|uniref:Mechanosensitive ion channel family protein n=2 Tax=Aequorivita TaxID=153265 RepID=A0AB35YSV8_9FLAO|nr:mechanosensitive ion channel family protein [Aequorivita sp. Ant34-E75]WGF92685.1 mechanosensitive ion channel family protein [Aequorivita sp. Ant34-E75]